MRDGDPRTAFSEILKTTMPIFKVTKYMQLGVRLMSCNGEVGVYIAR